MSLERYARPEMLRIWSEDARFTKWLEVEIAVCQALAEKGTIPWDAFEEIKQKASFSISRIAEIEKVTNHELIAFVENLSENIGPSSRYLHMGLTSSDVMDTALSLQLVESASLIIGGLKDLTVLLARRSLEHRDVPMMGRTHGVHAEPITLGFKFGVWAFELERHLKRLVSEAENVRVGKISGAVGTYSSITPDVEKRVCSLLGLRPFAGSTQIIGRDVHAGFVAALANLASSLERIAVDIRSLQRTEIAELAEPFRSGQKGSSAMPHKKNPILCERICGLARLLRSYSMVALENVVLWGERDISHSSAERFILRDACVLCDYMINKMAYIIANLEINFENMKKNIELSGGKVFSQRLLLELVRRGLSRTEAYDLVQKHALSSLGEEFKQRVKSDPEITSRIPAEDLERCFDLSRSFENLGPFFDEVSALGKRAAEVVGLFTLG